MKKRDKNLLISGLITAGIGLLVILLLCLLLPFLLLRLDVRDGFLKLFVILFLIIGALTSSLLASRLNQARAISASLLSGGMMLCVLLLSSIVISGKPNPFMLMLYVLIVASVSFLTPYFMQNRVKSKRARMKRMLKRR